MAQPNAKIDNAAASGQTPVVAAPTSPAFIRVYGYVLMAGGTTSVKWQDGNTDLTGAFPLTAQAGVAAPIHEKGWFDLTPGNALNLNSSAAVQVSGHVNYRVIGY